MFHHLSRLNIRISTFHKSWIQPNIKKNKKTNCPWVGCSFVQTVTICLKCPTGCVVHDMNLRQGSEVQPPSPRQRRRSPKTKTPCCCCCLQPFRPPTERKTKTPWTNNIYFGLAWCIYFMVLHPQKLRCFWLLCWFPISASSPQVKKKETQLLDRWHGQVDRARPIKHIQKL